MVQPTAEPTPWDMLGRAVFDLNIARQQVRELQAALKKRDEHIETLYAQLQARADKAEGEAIVED